MSLPNCALVLRCAVPRPALSVGDLAAELRHAGLQRAGFGRQPIEAVAAVVSLSSAEVAAAPASAPSAAASAMPAASGA